MTDREYVHVRVVRHAARIVLGTSLVEPVRRPLLLAGIPSHLVARMPTFARPSDQLYADLLYLCVRPEMMREWLENAELLAVGGNEEEAVRTIQQVLG